VLLLQNYKNITWNYTAKHYFLKNIQRDPHPCPNTPLNLERTAVSRHEARRTHWNSGDLLSHLRFRWVIVLSETSTKLCGTKSREPTNRWPRWPRNVPISEYDVLMNQPSIAPYCRFRYRHLLCLSYQNGQWDANSTALWMLYYIMLCYIIVHIFVFVLCFVYWCYIYYISYVCIIFSIFLFIYFVHWYYILFRIFLFTLYFVHDITLHFVSSYSYYITFHIFLFILYFVYWYSHCFLYWYYVILYLHILYYIILYYIILYYIISCFQCIFRKIY